MHTSSGSRREAWWQLRSRGHLLSFDDVVVGPVADDTVGLLIRQFSRGTIDDEKRGAGRISSALLL